MVREIVDQSGSALAIVVSANHEAAGADFITSPSSNLQLASMRRPKGYAIQPHRHLPIERVVRGTQEVLLIREGRMLASIFDQASNLIETIELSGGDVIILLSGGHGFEMIEDCTFFEVKQGPFVEGHDKEFLELQS